MTALPNTNDRTPLQKQHRLNHLDCFHKKLHHRPRNTDPTRGVVNVGWGWNASALESCPQTGVKGSLRFYQAIRNLTFGDMGIPLVVIRLGVIGLKKTKLVYLLALFEGRGEKVCCDLVCVECLWMIGVMAVMLMSYSRVVNVVLVFTGVCLVLRRRYCIVCIFFGFSESLALQIVV